MAKAVGKYVLDGLCVTFTSVTHVRGKRYVDCDGLGYHESRLFDTEIEALDAAIRLCDSSITSLSTTRSDLVARRSILRSHGLPAFKYH
jgi:hypothetical protein